MATSSGTLIHAILENGSIRETIKLVDIIVLSLVYSRGAQTKADHSQSHSQGYESFNLFSASNFVRGRIEHGKSNVEPESKR